MATAHNPNRPMSPHLQVWKWGPHMLVSILHRVTGSGMATVGTAVLVWWLVAAASGKDAYAGFLDVFTVRDGSLNILGWVLGVGLSLSFFQHIANGVRHLFMDAGANFEIKDNKMTALATMIFSVSATVLYWAYIVAGK